MSYKKKSLNHAHLKIKIESNISFKKSIVLKKQLIDKKSPTDILSYL